MLGLSAKVTGRCCLERTLCLWGVMLGSKLSIPGRMLSIFAKGAGGAYCRTGKSRGITRLVEEDEPNEDQQDGKVGVDS